MDFFQDINPVREKITVSLSVVATDYDDAYLAKSVSF